MAGRDFLLIADAVAPLGEGVSSLGAAGLSRALAALGHRTTVLTLASALFLPAVWRGALDGARPPAGWSAWRKTRYTLAFLIFAVLAIVLGAWGALAPWQP